MQETTSHRINHEKRRAAIRAFASGGVPVVKDTEYGFADYSDRDILAIPLRRDYNEVRQLRAQSVNINTAGGYLQHANFEDALEIALMLFDAFRPFATVDRVENGGDTHHPTVNDTAQIGVIVAENTQVSSNDVVAMGHAVFRPWKYGSQFLLIPNELYEDSGINLDLWLGRVIGQRIGRVQAKDWTNRVLIPSATQAAVSVSATVIGYTDMIALEYGVDPAYRQLPTTAWMCHNNIRESLRSLIDAEGNPVFAPRRRPDELDFLDGHPVLYNPFLASTITAGSQCLFFGDWSRIHIRDVRETRLVRLTERYADFDQIALGGFLRSDCVLMDAGTHPIQFLQQHA